MKPSMMPYIGVTGFMTPQEVRAVLEDFKAMRPDEVSYRLMVGVVLSSKTLSGKANRYPNRYPHPSRIQEIFQNDVDAFNVIHYNCDQGELPSLGFQLSTIVKEIAGPHLHGFQLNMAWPPVRVLRDFHEATQGAFRIILQLNNQAIAKCNGDVMAIAERVALYGDTIDAVLVDKSCGTGKPIDIGHSLKFLRALRKKTPKLRLVVAGGLVSETLSTILPLVDEFPSLSWDTESGVRTMTHDDLDLGAVFDYLDASTWMLDESVKTFSAKS